MKEQENHSQPIENRAELRPLSDEQLGNLIAAVGNHEAKAVTLLVMRRRMIYTGEELHQAVLEAQGTLPGWRIHHQAPFKYCERSLSPIGLVAREVVDPNLNTYGYVRTEHGEQIGVPLSGLLLDFSRRYDNVSLNQIFGATQSTSPIKEVSGQEENIEYRKRSPIIRFRIFGKLTTTELPIRETDLAESIGEKRDYVRNHLHQLARQKIITYESVKRDQPYALYKASSQAPDNPPPRFARYTFLTQEVHQLLSDHPARSWTAPEIADFFISKERYEEKHRAGLIQSIAHILPHLKRHGYLEPPKISLSNKSLIDLTHQQRTTLTDLVNILNGFKDQSSEVVERGRKVASRFISNPNAVAEVMIKAREYSPLVNKYPSEELELIILSIIQNNTDITAVQIRDILEEKYEKKVVVARVKQLIKSLKDQGLIVGSKEKTTLEWRST